MRIKIPDKKSALSMLAEAETQMEFTLTLPVNDKSGFNIVRNIYECFRMLGDALLMNRGILSTDHVEPINALLKMDVKTLRPISTIDNLRRLRHNINYNGYHPSMAEALDAVDIAKVCFSPLANVVKKEINK